MTAYWTQWFIQNVLPPSAWTLAGIAASHWAHRRRARAQHAEQLAQRSGHHEDLKAHIRRVNATPLIEQMTAAEFDRQLTVLMRHNPAVLDTFLRTRARMQGRSFRLGGERP